MELGRETRTTSRKARRPGGLGARLFRGAHPQIGSSFLGDWRESAFRGFLNHAKRPRGVVEEARSAKVVASNGCSPQFTFPSAVWCIRWRGCRLATRVWLVRILLLYTHLVQEGIPERAEYIVFHVGLHQHVAASKIKGQHGRVSDDHGLCIVVHLEPGGDVGLCRG